MFDAQLIVGKGDDVGFYEQRFDRVGHCRFVRTVIKRRE
jgi:hypothetical protein